MIKTQNEMLRLALEVLDKAELYSKFKNVFARRVSASEEVQTVTSDGVETINVANPFDYIIMNMTSSNEKYVIGSGSFAKKYKLEESLPNSDWDIYKPSGKVFGIELTDEVLDLLGVDDIFYFKATWGEDMIAKKLDFLAIPPDKNEVYRIARKEFFETYTLDLQSI